MDPISNGWGRAVTLAATRRLDVGRIGALALVIGLAALLDGLWIEASLNPRTFKPATAVALCEDWTNALCAGAFPALRTSSK